MNDDPQEEAVREREENDGESNESESGVTMVDVDDQETDDQLMNKDTDMGPSELNSSGKEE